MKKWIIIIAIVGLILVQSTKKEADTTWCGGADANRDGAVDVFDLAILANHYGGECTEPTWCDNIDVNQDGIIDVFDLAELANFYGEGECSGFLECDDTMDKGLRFFTRGVTIFEGIGYEDTCDGNMLTEYYCDDSKQNILFKEEDCGAGCEDGACVSSDMCGTIISEDGTELTLTEDILNCPMFGIMIAAQDVTIDCAGHEISLVPNPEIYYSAGKEDCSIGALADFNHKVYPSGIVICRRSGYNYVIRNCVIHHVNSGLYGGAITNYNAHPASTTGLIEDNYIYSSSMGIMQWGEYETIRNNVFEDCTRGIWLDEASGNVVEGNTFRNGGTGIWHYCGRYCDYPESPSDIIGNTFENNNLALYFTTGSDGFLRDNVIDNTFIISEGQTAILNGVTGSLGGAEEDIQNIFEGNTYNGQPFNGSEEFVPAVEPPVVPENPKKSNDLIIYMLVGIGAFFMLTRIKE